MRKASSFFGFLSIVAVWKTLEVLALDRFEVNPPKVRWVLAMRDFS